MTLKRDSRDTLQFPKKNPLDKPLDGTTIERTIRKDGQIPNKRLRELGEKLTPESCDYKASFAIHIYGPKILIEGNIKPTFVCQQSSGKNQLLPEIMSQMALVELRDFMMRNYGRKLPKNLSQKIITKEEN